MNPVLPVLLEVPGAEVGGAELWHAEVGVEDGAAAGAGAGDHHGVGADLARELAAVGGGHPVSAETLQQPGALLQRAVNILLARPSSEASPGPLQWCPGTPPGSRGGPELWRCC